MSGRGDSLKRVVDVVGASCALIGAAPLLVVVATMVRFDLGSPVLFRQQRPGRFGRPFELLKFRTMRAAAPSDADDPDSDARRLTRLGAFLRTTSLDELPELWNVLRGEMSLVGPRPLLMEYLPLYTEEQARRHDVRPGITGWAQINGRNAVSWREKFRLDLWYVENRSLRLDVEILCRTFATVLGREGISAPGEVTMPRFRGDA